MRAVVVSNDAQTLLRYLKTAPPLVSPLPYLCDMHVCAPLPVSLRVDSQILFFCRCIAISSLLNNRVIVGVCSCAIFCATLQQPRYIIACFVAVWKYSICVLLPLYLPPIYTLYR